MSSTAERVREHLKKLAPNTVVSVYALLSIFGNANAVYKFFSRETSAKRMNRVSYGMYVVNLTYPHPSISNEQVITVKASAFQKDVIPVEGDDAKFRTNGCKSAMKIGARLVRWIPVSVKKMRVLAATKFATMSAPAPDKVEAVPSKFDSLNVTILPENEKARSPFRPPILSLEIQQEMQKFVLALIRIVALNGAALSDQQRALGSIPYLLPFE